MSDEQQLPEENQEVEKPEKDDFAYRFDSEYNSQEEIMEAIQNYNHQPSIIRDEYGNENFLPTIPEREVDQNWKETYRDTVMNLSLSSPFFSYLVFQCRMYWTYAIPTAGAAGVNGDFYIFLNPHFFVSFCGNTKFRTFVIMHELEHLFFEHTSRRQQGSFDSVIWNQATDYFINNNIDNILNDEKVSQKFGDRIRVMDCLPLCLNHDYDGMTEESIYWKLLEQSKQQQKQQQDGDGEEGQEGEGQESGSGQGNGGENGRGYKNPHGQGEMDGEVQVEQSKGAEAETKRQASEAVRSAAVAASRDKSIGDAESDLIRQFVDLTEPSVNWKDELADFVTSAKTNRVSYNKANRRHQNSDVIFPVLDGDHIRVYYGIDSSGSMDDNDLTEGVSEMMAIMNNFDSWELDFSTCDTRAHFIGSYNSEEHDGDQVINEINIRGGGGTEMSPMVQQAQDSEMEDESYDVIIIHTDGHIPEEPVNETWDGMTPMIFLITSSGNIPSLECRTIQIDNGKKNS